MTYREFADGLRAWAKADRGLEAAVGLLIAHRVWVDRATSEPWSAPFPGARLFYRPTDDCDLAVVDWAEARHLAARTSHDVSAQDCQVLSIVIALAGQRRSTDPFELVGLSETNLTLVSDAIAHYIGVR